MKNRDIYNDVKAKLDRYRRDISLPGIDDAEAENCFIKQFVDSYKRIKYIDLLKSRDIDSERKNPNSDLYDPIRAAILHFNNGDINEAVWNLLLYVHFGKNLRSNYGLIQAVYGKLGSVDIWSWDAISGNLGDFRYWLNDNVDQIKTHGNFGNHRKYQSLKPSARYGTYQTFESFIRLVDGSFVEFIETIPDAIKRDKNDFFDYLFWHFVGIVGFGRLAVFDFLCMIGKVGVLDIEPRSPYLGNDGPVNGTRLLFDSNARASDLNDFLKDIGDSALSDYPFVMQILEDCVCNWQKSPTSYLLFRG